MRFSSQRRYWAALSQEPSTICFAPGSLTGPLMEPTRLAWRPNRGVRICICCRCICIWRSNSRDVRCSSQGDGDRCLVTSVRRERTNRTGGRLLLGVGGECGFLSRDERERNDCGRRQWWRVLGGHSGIKCPDVLARLAQVTMGTWLTFTPFRSHGGAGSSSVPVVSERTSSPEVGR